MSLRFQSYFGQKTEYRKKALNFIGQEKQQQKKYAVQFRNVVSRLVEHLNRPDYPEPDPNQQTQTLKQ